MHLNSLESSLEWWMIYRLGWALEENRDATALIALLVFLWDKEKYFGFSWFDSNTQRTFRECTRKFILDFSRPITQGTGVQKGNPVEGATVRQNNFSFEEGDWTWDNNGLKRSVDFIHCLVGRLYFQYLYHYQLPSGIRIDFHARLCSLSNVNQIIWKDIFFIKRETLSSVMDIILQSIVWCYFGLCEISLFVCITKHELTSCWTYCHEIWWKCE